MATNTLTDRENLFLAAKMTHNQQIIDVAEVLNDMNDIIADAPIQRANDITSHITSRRTNIPQPVWIKVGNGWDATVATLQQIREEIGIMKDRAQFPVDVMKLQPDQEKYRDQQEVPHIEGIAQEFANTLIYGNNNDAPEEFDGLATRYAGLSTYGVYDNSNGSGSGGSVQTSIWLVQWNPAFCHLVYPRNHPNVGITQEDEGKHLVDGDNSKKMWAYITEFEFAVGISIGDIRRVKRICNIRADRTQTYALNEDYIIEARNSFKTPGRIIMYVNETIGTQLDIMTKDKTNVYYSPSSPWGEHQLMFRDMPVRRCDAIVDTEAVLV